LLRIEDDADEAVTGSWRPPHVRFGILPENPAPAPGVTRPDAFKFHDMVAAPRTNWRKPGKIGVSVGVWEVRFEVSAILQSAQDQSLGMVVSDYPDKRNSFVHRSHSQL
jgi:hypothetical protein